MVVGDDFQLVLLATHVQPALAVDLIEDQLGGVLVGDAPGGGRPEEGSRDSEFDDVGGDGPAGTDRDQYEGEEREPDQRSRTLHREVPPEILHGPGW